MRRSHHERIFAIHKNQAAETRRPIFPAINPCSPPSFTIFSFYVSFNDRWQRRSRVWAASLSRDL